MATTPKEIVEELLEQIGQTAAGHSRMLGIIEAEEMMTVDPGPFVAILVTIARESPCGETRRAAVGALQRIDPVTHPQAALASAAAFERGGWDVDGSIRYAAALALGRAARWGELHSPPHPGFAAVRMRAVRRLVELTRDPVNAVRRSALLSLGEIGGEGIDPSVRDHVRRLSQDRTLPPDVRRAAFAVKWALDNRAAPASGAPGAAAAAPDTAAPTAPVTKTPAPTPAGAGPAAPPQVPPPAGNSGRKSRRHRTRAGGRLHGLLNGSLNGAH